MTELRATKIELLANVLRRCMGIEDGDNARHDFGDLNGGSLQRPTEVAAELLAALSDENLTIAAVDGSVHIHLPADFTAGEAREVIAGVLASEPILTEPGR